MRLLALYPLVEILAKFFLYKTASKVRSLQLTTMTCVIVASIAAVAAVLQLPPFFQFPLSIGFAMFYLVRNSDVEIYPDGIFVPIAVEIVAGFLSFYIMFPLFKFIIEL